MDRPRGQNYLNIFKFLISIHTKLNTRITNITFVFNQMHPCEREKGGKCEKVLKLKLIFSNILISILTQCEDNEYELSFSPNTSMETI